MQVTRIPLKSFIVKKGEKMIAKPYLPMAEKRAIAEVVANVTIKQDKTTGLYFGDVFEKELLMTGLLFYEYMAVNCFTKQGEKMFFEETDYDFIMENNLITKLEALSNDTEAEAYEVKKAFTDFYLLKCLVDKHIECILEIKNNVADRLADRMTEDVTPEALQNAVNELAAFQKTFNDKE